jgi:hypothetical protein
MREYGVTAGYDRLQGLRVYRRFGRDSTQHGTPDDWLERNAYSRFQITGLSLMGATASDSGDLLRHTATTIAPAP